MRWELRKAISQVAAISPGTQSRTSTLVSAAMADARRRRQEQGQVWGELLVIKQQISAAPPQYPGDQQQQEQQAVALNTQYLDVADCGFRCVGGTEDKWPYRA